MIECRLIKSLTSFSLILLCLIYGCGIFAADGNVKVGIAAKATRVEPVITINARPFDLMQVRLLDGPFKNAMELDRKYLLSLDEERLLHNFRVNAGLSSSARPLGGWEEPNCELRGHFVGHFRSLRCEIQRESGM